MEKKTKRVVKCTVCQTKFAFSTPDKAGVYRIKCPMCQKEIVFKVLHD